MKVSFIVVAYNAGSKLENLLEDLKKQDYNHNDIEIILIVKFIIVVILN